MNYSPVKKAKQLNQPLYIYVLMAQILKEQLQTLFWGQEGFWN